MKLVKTQPRFKCDFCNHRSTKFAMTVHEKRCWNNPKRYCDNCDNKGYIETDLGEGTEYSKIVSDPCIFCEKVKEIKARVKETQEKVDTFMDISEVPF